MKLNIRDKRGRFITKEGILILLVAILSAWFFQTHPEYVLTKQEILNRIYSPNSSSNEMYLALWNSYENIKYSYVFKFPPLAKVQKNAEMEPGSDNESADISVGIPGVGNLAQVEVWERSSDPVLEERNRLTDLPLADFAEGIRRIQVNDPNPYLTKEVGELEMINFSDTESYKFTLTGGFNNGFGGYGIPVGETYNFVVTENNGVKMIVSYPKGDKVAEQLISSFEFIQ